MYTFGATLAGLWILTRVRNTAKSRFKDFRGNKPRARLARVLFGFASIGKEGGWGASERERERGRVRAGASESIAAGAQVQK